MKILKDFIKEEIGRNYRSTDQVGNIQLDRIYDDYFSVNMVTDFDVNDNKILCVSIKLTKKTKFLPNIVKRKLKVYNNFTKHFKDENQASLFKRQLEEKLSSLLREND